MISRLKSAEHPTIHESLHGIFGGDFKHYLFLLIYQQHRERISPCFFRVALFTSKLIGIQRWISLWEVCLPCCYRSCPGTLFPKRIMLFIHGNLWEMNRSFGQTGLPEAELLLSVDVCGFAWREVNLMLWTAHLPEGERYLLVFGWQEYDWFSATSGFLWVSLAVRWTWLSVQIFKIFGVVSAVFCLVLIKFT